MKLNHYNKKEEIIIYIGIIQMYMTFFILQFQIQLKYLHQECMKQVYSRKLRKVLTDSLEANKTQNNLQSLIKKIIINI